jgi:hypothetical protein
MVLSILLSGSVFCTAKCHTEDGKSFLEKRTFGGGSVWDLGQASPIFL